MLGIREILPIASAMQIPTRVPPMALERVALPKATL